MTKGKRTLAEPAIIDEALDLRIVPAGDNAARVLPVARVRRIVDRG